MLNTKNILIYQINLYYIFDRDYNKDVDLLHLSQDIKDVFKYISM